MQRLVLLLSFIILSCYSLEPNCKEFHQGKFKFSQIINGEMKNSYFNRDSLYEIEDFDGKVDTSSIRWVNDCECILTKLSPLSYQDRPIQIRIINTNDNGYTFEYSFVGDSKNKRRGKIQKLKKLTNK